jgi:hypothetical protein
MQKKQPQTVPSVANSQVKNHKIVLELLSQVKHLDQYSAIKIELDKVEMKKATLRAALYRGAKKEQMNLAIASDDRNLYVFRR